MSDTPRTDSTAWDAFGSLPTSHIEVVTAHFARTLERELAALRAELETTKAARDGWKASFGHENARYQQACRACDEWIASNRELLAALKQWQHVWKETDCEYDDCQNASAIAEAAIVTATRENASDRSTAPMAEPPTASDAGVASVSQPAEATPETDAEYEGYPALSNDHFGYKVIRIGFARNLERQRNAALADLDRARMAASYCEGELHKQLAAERAARLDAEARLAEAMIHLGNMLRYFGHPRESEWNSKEAWLAAKAIVRMAEEFDAAMKP